MVLIYIYNLPHIR